MFSSAKKSHRLLNCKIAKPPRLMTEDGLVTVMCLLHPAGLYLHTKQQYCITCYLHTRIFIVSTAITFPKIIGKVQTQGAFIYGYANCLIDLVQFFLCLNRVQMIRILNVDCYIWSEVKMHLESSAKPIVMVWIILQFSSYRNGNCMPRHTQVGIFQEQYPCRKSLREEKFIIFMSYTNILKEGSLCNNPQKLGVSAELRNVINLSRP